MALARLRVERVAPYAAGVVRQQVDRDGRLRRGRADAVDVVARRDQRVEVARLAGRAGRPAPARRRPPRTPPRPACRGTGRRAPRRDGRAPGSPIRMGRRARRATATRRPRGRGATDRFRRPCRSRAPAPGTRAAASRRPRAARRSAAGSRRTPPPARKRPRSPAELRRGSRSTRGVSRTSSSAIAPRSLPRRHNSCLEDDSGGFSG